MWKFLKRLLGVYWVPEIRWPVCISLLFLAVIEGLGLISPYIFGRIISSLTSHKPLWYLMEIAGIACAVQLSGQAIAYLKDWYELRRLDFRIENAIDKQTLEKILSLSIGQHRNENSGLTNNVIKDGAGSLANLASLIIYTVVPMVAQMIIMEAALCWCDPYIGIMAILGGLGFIGLAVKTRMSLKTELKQHQKNCRSVGMFHSEVLHNLFLVIMYGQEERIVDEYIVQKEETCDYARSLFIRVCRWNILRSGFTTMVRYAILAFGVWRMTKGKYDAGYLVMIWLWTGLALSPLEQMNRMTRQILDMVEKTQKYFSLLDIQPAVTVPANPIRPKMVEGGITFRDVEFRYPTDRYIETDEENEKKLAERGSKTILQKVSFEVRPGERVALVGPSGAGKSTIISLLLRCYDPDGGQILVDGHDLRLLDPAVLRAATGVVEQDVCLFDKSLRYNIIFGLNGQGAKVTDDELRQLAETTRISQFFDRLTDGFDTMIGERGIKLSGGERQRVGIARALIKKPSILILDEATSHLDAVNEAAIQEAIEAATSGRTTLMIAHRLSTVIKADKIVVVDDGQVVAQGTHQELLGSCPMYASLVKTQLCA